MTQKWGLRIAVVVLAISALLQAGEQTPAGADASPAYAFPLWDDHESVAEYAKRVNLPPTRTFDLGNGVNLETVLIPAGKFVMGSTMHEKPIVGQCILGVSGYFLIILVLWVFIRAWNKHQRPQYSLSYLLLMTFVASFCVMGGVRWHEALKHLEDVKGESPAHEVTLTKPFYMSKTPVTQEQYEQVMGKNPSSFKGKINPVETVSWDDAQVFCNIVNERIDASVPELSPLISDPCLCRLPTEAEWEYSCRAGTRTEYYSGDSVDDLNRVAWWWNNSNHTTHPVGLKEANVFGLYDMHGNVEQWCQDLGEEYSANTVVDPKGSAAGVYRVLRGGSWIHFPGSCRAATRHWDYPNDRSETMGFRVVVAPACRPP